MFNGRLKVSDDDFYDPLISPFACLQVTICAAKDLQRTNFMSRHDGLVGDDKKEKAKPDVDPYVMIGEKLYLPTEKKTDSFDFCRCGRGLCGAVHHQSKGSGP